MSEQDAESSSEEFALSVEKLMGNPERWRRLGVPVAAGRSINDDGTPDYGLFGPSKGSIRDCKTGLRNEYGFYWYAKAQVH